MSCKVCQAKAEQIKEEQYFGYVIELGVDAIAKILHESKWCHSCILTSIEEKISHANFEFTQKKGENS